MLINFSFLYDSSLEALLLYNLKCSSVCPLDMFRHAPIQDLKLVYKIKMPPPPPLIQSAPVLGGGVYFAKYGRISNLPC